MFKVISFAPVHAIIAADMYTNNEEYRLIVKLFSSNGRVFGTVYCDAGIEYFEIYIDATQFKFELYC